MSTTPPNAFTADLNEADFATEVEQSAMPVFIDFHASWCGPCKALAPTFSALAETYAGQVKFLKVDADDNKALVQRLGVRGLPTLLLLRGGEVVERIVGSHHKAYFSDILNKHVQRPVVAAEAVARSCRAFDGDTALRDKVVARVRQHIDAGRIKHGAESKADGVGLMDAALAAPGDSFEATLGIPEAVGRIEQAVHALLIETTGEGADAQLRINPPHDARPLEWWQAIPPGADLQPLPSRFIHWLLQDMMGSEFPSDARAAVEAVADLHLRSARHGAVAAQDWDAARESANALLKGMGDGEASQPARQLLETAASLAWPVEQLENAIVDAIHKRLYADVEASVRTVYTPEEFAQSMALFNSIEKTFRDAYDAKYGAGPQPPRAEIEAMAEFKSGQTLWAPHRRIREAEMARCRRVSGEHLHIGLMQALVVTVATS